MKIYAITEKGVEKRENEDRIVINKTILSCGVFKYELDSGVFAIADGVGGNKAGAVASHYIASKLGFLESITQDSFTTLNEELIAFSNQSNKYTGMATTLSGVCVNTEKTIIFSIGNTRVYLLQGKKYLKQITSDDTTLNFLISTGQISQEDAENFERKNEITACFGGGNPSLFKLKIEEIDTLNVPFLISSDGLHDFVSVDEIEEIIYKYGVSEVSCAELMNLARENGSTDDISIIFGDI